MLQAMGKEKELREREAGLQAGEAAAAKYISKDSALEQREAALAEREAAMARATAAAEYARSEAEALWRSHKVNSNALEPNIHHSVLQKAGCSSGLGGYRITQCCSKS